LTLVKPCFWYLDARVVFDRALKQMHLWRDVAIGAVVPAVTLAFQVHWQLIPLHDWREHPWRWIASVVLPFIVAAAIDAIFQLLRAPWRVYQDQEISRGTDEKQVSGVGEYQSRTEECVV
jgi:hypothetical protein